MPLSKEEKYARHRAYQKTPEAIAKRKAYDKKRYSTPEYREMMRLKRQDPVFKEKARIASKKYRSTEAYKEKKRQYRQMQKYKDKRRDTILRSKFGITLEDYNRMLEEQGGGCAICSRTTYIKGEKPRSLAVDHCHRTGKIRGLLCRRCNVALGLFDDDAGLLKKSAKYLTDEISEDDSVGQDKQAEQAA